MIVSKAKNSNEMERRQDDGRIRAGAPQDSGKEGRQLPTMPF